MTGDKTEFLRAELQLIEAQVQFGDHKASLLVAGDAILLGISGGLLKVVSGCPQDGFTISCMKASVPVVLGALAAALVSVSIGLALLAVRPSGIHTNPPRQWFLFSHIARMKRREYEEWYRGASFDDLVHEALSEVHGKASFARQKFLRLRWAVDCTLSAVALIAASWLAAVALHH
jgi:hypothetical protein